jgi:hypothetical protein
MNMYFRLVSYQQRNAVEMAQVKSGFAHGAVIALLLWAMLGCVLFVVLR